MQRQHTWAVCFAVFLFASLVMSVLSGQSQVGSKVDQSEVDTTHFPIVDLTAAQPSDPAVRAKREAKGKKYNNKYAPVIGETSNGMFRVNHSLVDLSALPVEKSSAVILGEITDATAHLSEDKTSIYSEFVVRLQTVLKNVTRQNLISGTLLEVEREGGRVRLPSGKIVVSSVDHQDMPRVGGKYLLFLKQSLPKSDQFDQDFSILMGYELRDGKVFPLDQTSPQHPITAYRGRDESTLLTDLSSALAKASCTLPLN